MEDDRINLLDTFGATTIMKVVMEMKPILYNSRSESLAAIYLGELYRTFNKREQICMLNILHNIHDGFYRRTIELMNIKLDDKQHYIELAKARRF